MSKLELIKNGVMLYLIICIIYGCASPNTFYVDITKQAIISCKREGFKKLTISDKTKEVNLEGTESIIYFNQINNVSRTSIYDSVVYNYKLVLQPKSTYEIRADIGYDRAKFIVKFTTDSLGKVISASNLRCE